MTCKFVYEIGSNHNGSQARLEALIKIASTWGADIIKVQWIEESSDVFREGFETGKVLTTIPKGVTPGWLRSLADDCKVKLAFSVFNERHVAKLQPHADMFKVSSYDLLRVDLIQQLARTERPVCISTGMATASEVMVGVEAFGLGSPLYLMHTVSQYPTKPEGANLSRIEILRELRWPGPGGVGYSDHTKSHTVVLCALLKYGIDVLEIHFDLLNGKGLERRHSWVGGDIRHVKDFYRECLKSVKGDWPFGGEDHAERGWRADPSDGRRPMKDAEQFLRDRAEEENTCV